MCVYACACAYVCVTLCACVCMVAYECLHVFMYSILCMLWGDGVKDVRVMV